MNDKIGIILVHGAGLGNYIWDDLLSDLKYSSLMTEYPNRNLNDKANSELSFEDYVAKAILDTNNFEKEKLVVVAHSIGGLIGLRIAEYFF